MKRELKPNKDLVLQYFGFECRPMSIEESNIQAYETIFSDVLKGASEEVKEVLFYVLFVASFDAIIWKDSRENFKKESRQSLNELKELYNFFNEYDLYRFSSYVNAKKDFDRAASEMNIPSIIIKTGGKNPKNIKFSGMFSKAEIMEALFKLTFEKKERLKEPIQEGKEGSTIRKNLSLSLNRIQSFLTNHCKLNIKSKRQLNIIFGEYLSFIGYLPNEIEFYEKSEFDKDSYPKFESYLDQQVKRLLEVAKE